MANTRWRRCAQVRFGEQSTVEVAPCGLAGLAAAGCVLGTMRGRSGLGVAPQEVQQMIANVLADDGIKVEPDGEWGMASTPPPLTYGIMDPVREVAATIWPGVPIVPTMSTGATDGHYLNTAGVPTYGISGMFHDAEGSHAHGLDERIRVQSLLDGRRFLYELVKRYAKARAPLP